MVFGMVVGGWCSFFFFPINLDNVELVRLKQLVVVGLLAVVIIGVDENGIVGPG